MEQQQRNDSPRDQLKKLGSYVLEEFKKIKVNLPLIELMKVLEIRETLLGSLANTTIPQNMPKVPKNTSNAPQFNGASYTNVVQDEPPLFHNMFDIPKQPSFVAVIQSSFDDPIE